MPDVNQDKQLLLAAVEAAREGQREGNPPYGAVVFKAGQIVADGYNTVVTSGDRLAHAETNVLDSACRRLGSSKLVDCTLYCTSEPCILCIGAIAWTGIGRVVYGATDPVEGAIRELQGIDINIETLYLPLEECAELFATISQHRQ